MFVLTNDINMVMIIFIVVHTCNDSAVIIISLLAASIHSSTYYVC